MTAGAVADRGWLQRQALGLVSASIRTARAAPFPSHCQQMVSYVPRTKSEEDLAIALAISASLAPGP